MIVTLTNIVLRSIFWNDLSRHDDVVIGDRFDRSHKNETENIEIRDEIHSFDFAKFACVIIVNVVIIFLRKT